MDSFLIKGLLPLRGQVQVSGSKNAALPCLAATLLVKGKSVLTNVPNISDVRTMIGLLEYLGCRVTFVDHRLTVDTTNLQNRPLGHDQVSRLRASILLLGPMLARFGEVKMAFPGGCVIGKRSVRAHLNAFRDLGAKLINTQDWLHLKANKLQANNFLMWEASVTATENALTAAAATTGLSEIRLAAAEPHVANLAEMLNKMGAKISGLGSSTLIIRGRQKLKPVHHQIVGDYLEMGTLAIAAAIVPGSKVTIKGLDPHQLDALWLRLAEAGGSYKYGKNSVTVTYQAGLKAFSKLETRVHPGFPTDLQAPFAVLLTQAQGTTHIFETLFEGRFQYLKELKKMGAKTEILNDHQAVVTGRTILRGRDVESCDIRAGAAVLLAGLAAKGKTTIRDINYIDRGYDDLESKLNSLGADIRRVNRQNK